MKIITNIIYIPFLGVKTQGDAHYSKRGANKVHEQSELISYCEEGQKLIDHMCMHTLGTDGGGGGGGGRELKINKDLRLIGYF